MPWPQLHLRRLQTPEGEPAGQAGPQVPPAKKNSVCRCPAEKAEGKEGSGDGAGVGARLLGARRLLSFRHRASQDGAPTPGLSGCPGHRCGGCGTGTTAPPVLPRGQSPLHACLRARLSQGTWALPHPHPSGGTHMSTHQRANSLHTSYRRKEDGVKRREKGKPADQTQTDTQRLRETHTQRHSEKRGQ